MSPLLINWTFKQEKITSTHQKLRMADTTILWCFMVLVAGAADQYVNYPGPVCAVKGSTVTLPCNFTLPNPSLQIIRVIWCQNHEICHRPIPSVYDSENQNNDPRYQYLGDKKGNCTLQIRDVRMTDHATFRFRMEATDPSGTWTEQSGVKVTVVADATEMRITSSTGETAVTKGQTVTLHCTARCTFHQLEVAWFRDDHALSETGPTLQLRNLTAKDSGSYTCALKININRRSHLYSLHVEAAEEEIGYLNYSINYLIVHLVLVAVHTVLIVIVASVVIKRTGVCRAAAGRTHRAERPVQSGLIEEL